MSFNQKKKRDTSAVSRWRGWGARDSRAPHKAQARVRAIERIAGGDDEGGQGDDDGENHRSDGANLEGGDHAEACENDDEAIRTEAEVVAWDMVGAVSALTMLIMGFSL